MSSKARDPLPDPSEDLVQFRSDRSTSPAADAVRESLGMASEQKPLTRYVSTFCVSEDLRSMLMITKDRGPAWIIGKLTLPGGRIEGSDVSDLEAGLRELAEETGVVADPARAEVVTTLEVPFGTLTIVFAVADISQAKTLESEVVSVHDVDALQAVVNEGSGMPESVDEATQYAPDLREITAAACVRLERLRAQRDQGAGVEGVTERRVLRP